MASLLQLLDGLHADDSADRREQTLLVGRGEDCDVRLPTDFASRHHCLIRRVGRTLFVSDLGSKNGTSLNGRRLDDERVLRHGDVLTIGDLSFAVQLPWPLRHDSSSTGSSASPRRTEASGGSSAQTRTIAHPALAARPDETGPYPQ